MNDQLDFNPDTEKYQNLHFEDDFDKILHYALEDAKKFKLASLDEVLITDEKEIDYYTILINDYLAIEETGYDPIDKALGFIRDSIFSYWLFVTANDVIEADVIAVYLDREASKGHKSVTDITNDNYQIISRDPLILRSMYGSIHGFRKKDHGAEHFLICDADAEDWG
jgi:hypothetical protein